MTWKITLQIIDKTDAEGYTRVCYHFQNDNKNSPLSKIWIFPETPRYSHDAPKQWPSKTRSLHLFPSHQLNEFSEYLQGEDCRDLVLESLKLDNTHNSLNKLLSSSTLDRSHGPTAIAFRDNYYLDYQLEPLFQYLIELELPKEFLDTIKDYIKPRIKTQSEQAFDKELGEPITASNFQALLNKAKIIRRDVIEQFNSDTADGLFKLGQQCLDNGLYDYAIETFKVVVYPCGTHLSEDRPFYYSGCNIHSNEASGLLVQAMRMKINHLPKNEKHLELKKIIKELLDMRNLGRDTVCGLPDFQNAIANLIFEFSDLPTKDFIPEHEKYQSTMKWANQFLLYFSESVYQCNSEKVEKLKAENSRLQEKLKEYENSANKKSTVQSKGALVFSTIGNSNENINAMPSTPSQTTTVTSPSIM